MKTMLMMIAMATAMATPAQVRIAHEPLVSGFAPTIRIEGLKAAASVRVHLFRMFAAWEEGPGGWRPVPRPIHAWADVEADARGIVDLSRFAVKRGTYRGADAYGLFWSGRRSDDPLLADAGVAGFDPATLKDGESRMVVSAGPVLLAQAPIATVAPRGLRTVEVAQGRLNGTYSAPADGRRHPTVVLLHGSEGGDRGSAREIAERFAGQGFAAFAFTYFAWDLKKIAGVPNAHVNQPIESLIAVRDWLAEQPEVEVARLGLYGHSKGAEFAAVAAVRLPWVRAVAACVPSDAVWEGYGIGDGRNRPEPGRVKPERMSSWSWQGEPLPYIALPPGDDRTPYFDNTAYYEARRAADPAAARAALIPVERARARFLWLGAGRDEVWASGAMASRNHARMRRAGAGGRSELRVYPAASHAICGEGSYPTRVWRAGSSDPRVADPDADGPATIDGWRRIVDFFRRSL